MQVVLGWLLQRAPNILLISGTCSVAHLRENIAAALACQGGPPFGGTMIALLAGLVVSLSSRCRNLMHSQLIEHFGVSLRGEGEHTMPDFRCNMLDPVGHVISTADVVADDLEAAKHHAFSILAARRREPWTAVYGLEIWSGEVKVFPTSTLGRKA